MCFEENWKSLSRLRRRIIYYVKPASATTDRVINRHAVYIHTYYEHESTKPTGSRYTSPSLFSIKRDRLIIIPRALSCVIGIFGGKLLSHLSLYARWIIITNNNDRNRVKYLVQPPPILQSRSCAKQVAFCDSRNWSRTLRENGTLPPPSTYWS